jgi:hypothetical protein
MLHENEISCLVVQRSQKILSGNLSVPVKIRQLGCMKSLDGQFKKGGFEFFYFEDHYDDKS